MKKYLGLAAVATLLLAGCASTTSSTTTSSAASESSVEASSSSSAEVSGCGPDALVSFIPKALNIPYFATAYAGAEKGAAETGGGLVQVGGATFDATEQATIIDTQARQPDVCVLAISANDPEALIPAIERARDAGKRIITWDSTTSSGSEVFVNQASAQAIGEGLVQSIADQIGGQGQIAIVSGASTSANQNTWIEWMKKELEKPENAGIELVKIAYADGQDAKAAQEIQGLLKQYPDLRGIIAPDAVNLPVAARIIKSEGLSGQVAVTGLALPSQMANYVKDGTIRDFALWDVEKLGKLAYYVAYLVGTGQLDPKPGATFTAGDMGEFTINEDGEVLLGPLLFFTKDNVDQYKY